MICNSIRTKALSLVLIFWLLTGCMGTEDGGMQPQEGAAVNLQYGNVIGTELDAAIVNEIGQHLITEGDRLVWLFIQGEQVDFQEKITDSRGVDWYQVTNYKTKRELESAVKAIYSQRLSEEILSEGFSAENPKYKEISNKLYVTDNVGGMGIPFVWDAESIQIQNATEKSLVLLVNKHYLIEDRDEAATVELVNENNKWLLDTSMIY